MISRTDCYYDRPSVLIDFSLVGLGGDRRRRPVHLASVYVAKIRPPGRDETRGTEQNDVCQGIREAEEAPGARGRTSRQLSGGHRSSRERTAGSW